MRLFISHREKILIHNSCILNTDTMNNSSSGTVLIMVLILSAIMFLIASTLLLITMTEVHISDFEQRSTQAFYTAESSITLGLSELRKNADHRSNKQDIMSIGGNIGMLAVKFVSLSPSLYHLVLKGTGTVPGLNAAEAKRIVERAVVVKPFVLFAWRGVTVSGGCKIIGKIHGNDSVSIDKLSTVKGDLTSSNPVTIGDEIFNDPAPKTINNGIVDGTVSSREPEITFPTLPIALYLQKYWYNAIECKAQPLIHKTVILSPVDGVNPPVPSVDIYSGEPTPENPAGIFYLESEIIGSFIIFNVTGTVVDPFTTGSLSINGSIKIMPGSNEDFKHFPALITARNLNITFTSVESLNPFFSYEDLKKSQIEGLIYADGDVSFTENDTTGNVMTGSILGENISITGNSGFQVTYDSTIISDPPPGIDLIEPGEWKESFE